LFNYVFQQLPNRALSDEGCALAEVDQLYHRLSLLETTHSGFKRKTREQPTSQGTAFPTAQTRAPTDSALILYRNYKFQNNHKQQPHLKGKRAAD
jgi:hypothetical protein